MNKIFSILLLIGLYGCAASVSTEQYVGEYEKQKSLDEVEITKVDGLKIVELKINKTTNCCGFVWSRFSIIRTGCI